MSILLGILTFVLILVSIFLVLIVLMQKSKDGGIGSALGGGAAEAAFGADTNNVLVQATKYSAILFFVLAFLLYLGRIYERKADQGAAGGALPAITAPAAHTVAATGELQNTDILSAEQRARLAEARTADAPVYIVTPAEADLEDGQLDLRLREGHEGRAGERLEEREVVRRVPEDAAERGREGGVVDGRNALDVDGHGRRDVPGGALDAAGTRARGAEGHPAARGLPGAV